MKSFRIVRFIAVTALLAFSWGCLGNRRGSISKIRSKLAGNLVEEFGISFAEAARQLGVSTSAISKIISRTENRKST